MKQNNFETPAYVFYTNSSTLTAKLDAHNCGVIHIGGVSLSTLSSAKSVFKQLKNKTNRTSRSSTTLKGRKILLGTINSYQLKASTGKILKELGFKIGQSFINPNSTNKCYIVTANIDTLKI